MNLTKFLKRTGNKKNNRTKAMIDTLESRSMLSATPVAGTATTTAGESHFTALAATKASVTTLKIAKTSPAGTAVTVSAAVQPKSGTGVPTGTVTFYSLSSGDVFSPIGTATLNSSGIARLSTTFAVGEASVYAQYNGSGKFVSSRTPAVVHTTTPAASTTKLSITTPTSDLIGNGTGLLARVGSTVGGVTPTGRVAFYDGGTLLGSKVVDSNGHARWLANYLFIGTHSLKAIYQGNTQLLGHRSPVRAVTVAYPTLTTKSDGLKVGTVAAGSGTGAIASDYISVDYTGYIAATGAKFQSSLDTPGQTLFAARPDGQGGPNHTAIQGFGEGLVGAKVGETRVMYIPANIAYGANPPDGIPVNADLVFVIYVRNISTTAP